MRYSPEFITAIKEAFPLSEGLHRALENGDDFVGRYLDDVRQFRLSPRVIIEAFEKGRTIQDVLLPARWALKKGELYGWWLREVGVETTFYNGQPP